jgi:hypothetical protein
MRRIQHRILILAGARPVPPGHFRNTAVFALGLFAAYNAPLFLFRP